jgi:hypothetical protein
VASERAAVDEDVEAGVFSFNDDVHRCGHWIEVYVGAREGPMEKSVEDQAGFHLLPHYFRATTKRGGRRRRGRAW